MLISSLYLAHLGVFCLFSVYMVGTDFLTTKTPLEIFLANKELSEILPKKLLIYNDENRFGVFTLLFLHSSYLISYYLNVLTQLSLLLAFCVSSIIGIVKYFIFVSINPFNHIKCQNWYTHKEIRERKNKHEDSWLYRTYLSEKFNNLFIKDIENIGLSQSALPVYIAMKTLILSTNCIAIYILTIIQRTLLNCVNFIDEHIFSKATLNQDLYWLTIKTGNKSLDTGLTPIVSAIKNHNIRAMKALISDPYTNINEPLIWPRTLYFAIDEKFDHGVELILSDPSYRLNPKLSSKLKGSPLIEVLMKLIERKDEYWLKRILNHDKAKNYKPCQIVINKCIELQFIRGVELLIEKSFSVSLGFNYLAIFTRENRNVLVPILQAINSEVRSKVVSELYKYIYHSCTTSITSIKKMMKIYLNDILKKDITGPLAEAIGVTKEDFDRLCEETEVLESLRDMDLLDVVTFGLVTTIPLRINDEKEFYALETIEGLRAPRRSPMTTENIEKVTPAEEEYLEKVILCFLKYAINKNENRMIEHIKNQKTIKLSDGSRRKMERMIDSYNQNITRANQHTPNDANEYQTLTAAGLAR
ncbi:MAG: hypothetical protein VX737_01090 [Pseudomonadota bacterium]|nr:hypothetical protein [Pseudomonadota bacterium]